MRCFHCGTEIINDISVCPHCGQGVSEVKVLSRQERDNFNGVTLGEADSFDNATIPGYKYQGSQGKSKVYVRQVSIGGGILSRLMWGGILLLLAFLGLIIFAALPIIILLLSVGGIIFYYFLRRR